ncbi:MAG: hypothetical protein FJ387_13680 [Verrucomicrobia bacterium]|nr:hypothetical protein [Verrucomicrobiota bacterium]
MNTTATNRVLSRAFHRVRPWAASLLAASALAQDSPAPARVLADFESVKDVARWTGLEVQRTAAHASAGRHGMQFTVPRWVEGQEERPGVQVELGRGRKQRDWSGYGAVELEVWVEGDRPGKLGLKLRDAQGRSSWTTHQAIAPGQPNTVALLIDDAAADCDITQVAEVVLYGLRPEATRTYTVDRLRLLPRPPPPLAGFYGVYPNYRGWVFPAQDEVEVGVAVAAREHGLKPAELALELTLLQGDQTVSTRVALREPRAQAAASTRSLAPGPLTVRAVLVHTRKGTQLAGRDWTVRKLSVEEVRQLAVYVNHQNRLVVDGKPFFPLGWYGRVNEQDLAELADSPFNCLLAYGTNHVPKERMLGFLDRMKEHGLKLIYCLNDVYPTATYFDGKKWEGREGNETITSEVVAAYREHPAVLAWYLNDELPRELLPYLMYHYRRVREGDPDHPCLIVLCNRRDFPLFPPTTDMLGVDPYPIPREPVTLVSDFLDAAQRAVMGRQPIWLVAQAFGWYQYRSKNPDRGHAPTPEELETGRAPTYEEARCMTYLGLVHGAQGLLYYCYYDLRVLPQYAEMWAWLKRIGGEVKELTPVLLAPDDPGGVQLARAAQPIHARLKRLDHRLYLLAVNSGREGRTVKFDLPYAVGPSVKVWFEGRQLAVKGRRFTDRLEPLAARVYELELPAR